MRCFDFVCIGIVCNQSWQVTVNIDGSAEIAWHRQVELKAIILKNLRTDKVQRLRNEMSLRCTTTIRKIKNSFNKQTVVLL